MTRSSWLVEWGFEQLRQQDTELGKMSEPQRAMDEHVDEHEELATGEQACPGYEDEQGRCCETVARKKY
jgi:hypothetical protein